MMRPRTVLISLLIVASVLVDCAAMVFADNHPDAPSAKSLLASLAISQVALVSIWAGIGRTWVFARLTALLGACWFWSGLLGHHDAELGLAWLIILAFGSWPILSLIWAWGANGLQFVDSSNDGANVIRRRNRQRQFRIVDLLGATFVLAILLAMMREHLAPGPDWLLHLGIGVVIAWPLLVIAMATSLLTIWLMWVSLRRHVSCVRATALVTTVCVAGLYLLASRSLGVEPLVGSGGMFTFGTTFYLAGSLLVIRVAGYRVATGTRLARSIVRDPAAHAAAATH